MSRKKPPPPLDPRVQELLNNPIFMAMTGLVVLKVLTSQGARPAWLKDAPPVDGKVAGPWRGKGSFGRHFGSQASHK